MTARSDERPLLLTEWAAFFMGGILSRFGAKRQGPCYILCLGRRAASRISSIMTAVPEKSGVPAYTSLLAVQGRVLQVKSIFTLAHIGARLKS